MNTYFSVTTDTNNGSGSCVTTAADTLEKAIARAIQDAAYYAVECGYRPTFSITQLCEGCHGEGTVIKRMSRYKTRAIRCKECRGKNPLVEIVRDVPFLVHANCGAEFNGKLTGICDQVIAKG